MVRMTLCLAAAATLLALAGVLPRPAAPVTEDSSIVVTTTADFAKGNDEGMISFDTDAISRAAPTGGWLEPWAGVSGFATARQGHCAVAYNGYLYVLGGFDGTSYLGDVQYAPIHGDGTLGSWYPTTGFAPARWHAAAAVYNGYLYLTGGFDPASGGDLSDVRFARINGDGTLGTWSGTTGLGTGRSGHTAVACSGRLYVLGGYGGGYLNSTRYAPFNADGTLGAWAGGTSFSTGRCYHASVAYNDSLYVIGGTSSGGNRSDVQYAPVRPDGSLGPWSATSPFATARQGHGCVAHRGFLYLLGGSAGSSYFGDVQFAPVNPNGTLGPWRATRGLPSGRGGLACAVHWDRLFALGGSGSGGLLDEVRAAPFGGAGGSGGWGATTALPSARSGHASVAFRGFLYLLGGNGGSDLSDVWYAPLGADGTLGAWASTSSFTTARHGHAAAVWDGCLYVLGGRSGVTSLSDVQYARVNADGTVGAWSPTTGFATARYGHAAVARGGFLYVLGGTGGADLSDVQYAPIGVAGTVGAWASTTGFPTARHGHACAAWGSHLYILGGAGGSGDLDDVQYAPLNPDGTVGTWVGTAGLPDALSQHAAAVYGGCLYVTGGSSGGSLRDALLRANLQADGSVGSWGELEAFSGARYGHAAAAYGGFLYVLGGETGSSFLGDVQYAPLSSAGALGAWSTDGSFAGPRYGHAAAVCNGFLYVLGGFNGGAYLNDVQYAPIGPDGTLGAWTLSPNSFATPRYFHAAVAYGGFLYVMGGYGGSYQGDVQYAPLAADGSVGLWSPTSGWLTGMFAPAAAAHDGFLYAAGGFNATPSNGVQYAPIHADGSVGLWSPTAGFLTPRYHHAMTVYAGRLYLLGGKNASSVFNDVQHAPIQADGTVGAWRTNPTRFDLPRYAHTAAAYNGHLYVLGGHTGTAYLSDAQVASVLPGGDLGEWNATAGFATRRYGHASAVSDGTLYVTGGWSDVSGHQNDAQHASMIGPALRGAWSVLADTGPGNRILDAILFESLRGGQGFTLTYAVASDTAGLFGGRTVVQDARPSVAYITGLGCGRYAWARIEMDDRMEGCQDPGGARKDVQQVEFLYSTLAGVGDSVRVTKNGAVDLDWQASPNATSYDVERCDATSGPCTPDLLQNTTGQHYGDDVVDDGRCYWYSIAARNGECRGE